MALFDFNTFNIENFTEGGGGWFKIFISTVGGFLLKTGYDEFQKRKEVTEAGETFEYQIKGLKSAIASQANEVYTLLTTKNYQSKIQVRLLFTDNFRLLTRLKELYVVKYFSRTLGKDDASTLVYKRYNQIKALEIEIDRLKACVFEIRKQSDILVSKYSELHNKNKQAFIEYRKLNELKVLEGDQFFETFVSLYSKYHKDKQISMPWILSIANTFHKEIENSPLNDTTHTLYQELNNFRVQSKIVISEFLSHLNSYNEVLKIILTSFKSTYKGFYDEEMLIDKSKNIQMKNQIIPKQTVELRKNSTAKLDLPNLYEPEDLIIEITANITKGAQPVRIEVSGTRLVENHPDTPENYLRITNPIRMDEQQKCFSLTAIRKDNDDCQVKHIELKADADINIGFSVYVEEGSAFKEPGEL